MELKIVFSEYLETLAIAGSALRVFSAVSLLLLLHVLNYLSEKALTVLTDGITFLRGGGRSIICNGDSVFEYL
jgi:hypothetical protein